MGISIEEAKSRISEILDSVDAKTETPSETTEIRENESAPSAEEMMKEHPAGDCFVPNNMDELPKLSLGGCQFMAPKYVNNMGSASHTDNQQNRPWCAAYSCANWAEFIKWKLDGYPKNIDPEPIYRYAKSIDGDPNGDGTTLVAVLQYLLDKGYFDKGKCTIKNIWRTSNARELIKFAVFKFGAILGAFNITSEWYMVSKDKTSVTAKKSYPSVGGHAVIIIGYDENGVFIQNSWGTDFGNEGFLLLSWKAFDEQFLYASVLSNCLDGLTINT